MKNVTKETPEVNHPPNEIGRLMSEYWYSVPFRGLILIKTKKSNIISFCLDSVQQKKKRVCQQYR